MTLRREAIRISDDILKIRRHHVAVIPIPDPTMTPSGLYIPDEARQRSDHGVVKILGIDVPDLSIGDHVLFSGYSGTKISIRGEGELIIMPHMEVLAILPEKHISFISQPHIINMIERVKLRAMTSGQAPDISQILDWIIEMVESYDGESFEF